MFGMFGTGQKEEAMLYYLYMMSDGEVSYSEEKLFNEICKELNLSEEDKQLAVVRCKEIAKDPKATLDVIMSEKIDEQVGRAWLGLKKDTSSLAKIIWNLVNLGYADTYYSEEEKRIVKHLLEKWEVSPEVYQEMVDTADTILALTKQKEWVISKFPKGRERDEKEKKIDTEINTMLSDIKLTIEELTMDQSSSVIKQEDNMLTERERKIEAMRKAGML